MPKLQCGGTSPPKTSGKVGIASPAPEWRITAPTRICT